MAATLQRTVTGARGLLDRVFPRGAILLSVLSLGYFATGIIRNRVFANTYGAGAELDAYNAAFRIPEIALDVLVAAGLTAPFVPIYSRLRHDDGDEPANDFGRTVLTGAVGLMTIASIGIFIAAPWLAGVIAEGFDPATQDLYVQLLRINCLAQVMFAASIALGEVLVAHRRFLFYALAPILYTTGIIVGTVLFAVALRDRRIGLGRGRRRGRAPGDPGDRHEPDVVPDPPGLRRPHRGLSRVPALDGPAHVLGRHRPADHHLLHARRRWTRGRRGLGPQLRARLPGPSGQPDRRLVLAGRLPSPVGGIRGRRPVHVQRDPRPRTWRPSGS